MSYICRFGGGFGQAFQPYLPQLGAYMPPLPCICVYLCKYMYECVEKTLLFPIISLSQIPKFKRGDPYDLFWMPPRSVKNYKSQLFLGGSGHPNFMNPFEYGKSFLDKLFTNRFGTITQTKP